jgi:prepilin-type N-terminal cleavage/methylation domain-containing protein/prepilin-type processing-associated H-X9-DG protein
MTNHLRCDHRARAFTVLELMVVIAIVGILIALLLPAIQFARESARRFKCANNLRQLSVAVHMYSDTHRVLPINVGPWSGQPGAQPQLSGKGWIVGVLPQLDEPALFDAFVTGLNGDFISGSGLKHPTCREAMKTRLPTLQCPSDESVRHLSTQQFQWNGIPVALTSYKGVIGDSKLGGWLCVHNGSVPDCHSAGGCNGLFFRTTYREPQRLADVRDGTSNTFMLGEDIPEHNFHSVAFYSNGDYASCHAPLNYFPDPPTPTNWWNVMSFRSRHNGGANFAFSDGGIRFISESIGHEAYRALSTKANNEAVSAGCE